MKKLISVLLLTMFLGLQVQAATISSAISLYKKGNYTGCFNELVDVINDMSKDKTVRDLDKKILVISAKYDLKKIKNGDKEEISRWYQEFEKLTGAHKDTIDKWAYVFYYMALSLHQIGLTDQTRDLLVKIYSVAFTLSPRTKIGEYSMMAIDCINNPNSCANSDMDEFIRSGKQVSDDIIKEEILKNLKKHTDEINQGKDLSWYSPDLDNKIAWVDTGMGDVTWVDAGVPRLDNIGKMEPSMNDIPTDEEIGKAIRTLQRAGINIAPQINSPMNNEYAQINALLNNGNNNYSNDYSTMMMMNNGKVSPELMQTLMRQQMMGGYGF